MRVLPLGLAVFLCVGLPSANAGSYRVCIGDDGNKCPVGHNAFFGCGTTAAAAARSLCTVGGGGTTKILPYQIVTQDWHDGGSCGYVWFEVNCPNPHLSVRACIGEGGIGDRCPVSHEAFFGCGTSEAAAADSICTIVDDTKKNDLAPSDYSTGATRGGSMRVRLVSSQLPAADKCHSRERNER